MQQSRRRKGQIINDPAYCTGTFELQIGQTTNVDALVYLLAGRRLPIGIFLGIAAEGVHSIPGPRQRQCRIEWQCSRGHIFWIKELTQKKNIPLHLPIPFSKFLNTGRPLVN